MMELWKELKGRLKVEYQTSFVGDGAGGPTVAVVFSVTNVSGPPTHDEPDIVFEHVVLRVGVPPRWQSYELGTLVGQQTERRGYQCSLAELPDLEYDVVGEINPKAFFRTVWHSQVRALRATFPASAYLSMLEHLQLHRWRDVLLPSLSAPTSRTTLEDLNQVARILQGGATEWCYGSPRSRAPCRERGFICEPARLFQSN